MSMVDNILPRRGPGRPRKDSVDISDLAAALNAPIPAGIEDAAKKVEAAVAAFELASTAHNESKGLGLPRQLQEAVDKAQRDLNEATVMREVADRLGGDGPSDEELAALEKAVVTAISARDSSGVRTEAYRKVTEERRETLSQARQEMWKLVDEWVDAAFAAADRQIAEGVRLISEAHAAAGKLDTWQNRSFPDLRFGSVAAGGDVHRGGETDVEVPGDILRAVHTWRRADRAICRR